MNVESMLIAAAVNTGISYLSSLDLIPETSFTFDISTDDGIMTYNASEFVHPNYPNMQTILCIYQDAPQLNNYTYALCTVVIYFLQI